MEEPVAPIRRRVRLPPLTTTAVRSTSKTEGWPNTNESLVFSRRTSQLLPLLPRRPTPTWTNLSIPCSTSTRVRMPTRVARGTTTLREAKCPFRSSRLWPAQVIRASRRTARVPAQSIRPSPVADRRRLTTAVTDRPASAKRAFPLHRLTRRRRPPPTTTTITNTHLPLSPSLIQSTICGPRQLLRYLGATPPLTATRVYWTGLPAARMFTRLWWAWPHGSRSSPTEEVAAVAAARTTIVWAAEQCPGRGYPALLPTRLPVWLRLRTRGVSSYRRHRGPIRDASTRHRSLLNTRCRPSKVITRPIPNMSPYVAKGANRALAARKIHEAVSTIRRHPTAITINCRRPGSAIATWNEALGSHWTVSPIPNRWTK